MTNPIPSTEEISEVVKKFNDQMNTVASHYATRQPNEIDLIGIVRERLIASGLGDRIAAYDSSRFIVEAADKSCSGQQYQLNRWLTLQFMTCSQDTSVQRYALIYEINAAEWLKVFDRVILPALIDFDLPVQIN